MNEPTELMIPPKRYCAKCVKRARDFTEYRMFYPGDETRTITYVLCVRCQGTVIQYGTHPCAGLFLSAFARVVERHLHRFPQVVTSTETITTNERTDA